MKAIVHDRYGSADVLELRDIDTPVPADTGVVVRVGAASITGKRATFVARWSLPAPEAGRLSTCRTATIHPPAIAATRRSPTEL